MKLGKNLSVSFERFQAMKSGITGFYMHVTQIKNGKKYSQRILFKRDDSEKILPGYKGK